MASNIPFCQMVRASGLAEPWTHSSEEVKFDQFGWRCTTKESGYGINTLVGNYSEERFDLKHRLKSKPLPSQYNHYFKSTYDTDYNHGEPPIPSEIRGLKRRQPTSFPGHQPEFDLSAGRAAYNDWNTTSTASYRPYSDQKLPLPTVLKDQQVESTTAVNNGATMTTTPIVHLGARAGPPSTGGYVIAAPHAGPGTGAGAHQTVKSM